MAKDFDVITTMSARKVDYDGRHVIVSKTNAENRVRGNGAHEDDVRYHIGRVKDKVHPGYRHALYTCEGKGLKFVAFIDPLLDIKSNQEDKENDFHEHLVSNGNVRRTARLDRIALRLGNNESQDLTIHNWVSSATILAV